MSSRPEMEEASESDVRLLGLTRREVVVEAAAAMPWGGLCELRSRSQKSKSTSPMSEEAREVGGLIPTLTPTLTRAGGERAPGLVSGEELDTSEQLSSPIAERLRVATPEPKTNIPAARAVASTLAMRGTFSECRYRPRVPNSIISAHSLITTREQISLGVGQCAI